MNRPNKGVGNTDGVARVKLAKRESVTTDRVQQKTGVEICGVGEAAVRSNLVAGKVSIWLQPMYSMRVRDPVRVVCTTNRNFFWCRPVV